MRRIFLDFGWLQQIVMFWVEWDSVNSTGVEETFAAWRTHNSYVHLENLHRKIEKLKRHKFPTKRRTLFWLFSTHIWTLTCYISANVLQGVWISEKCEKCKNGSWRGKNSAEQLKRKFLAETAEITEATIISLAWAGGRNFYPAGRPRYKNVSFRMFHRTLGVCNVVCTQQNTPICWKVYDNPPKMKRKWVLS